MTTTISTLAKLGAAAAAAAVAVLFLGAGIAQGDVSASAHPTEHGVFVSVESAPGAHGPQISGWCTYTSTVQGNPWGRPLPAINVPFYLPENAPGRLWFPSFPTGSTWDVTVTCSGPGGGESRISEHTTTVW